MFQLLGSDAASDKACTMASELVARGAAGSLAMVSAQLAWNASTHCDMDGRVLMERQAASMRRCIGDLMTQIQSLGFQPVDSREGGEGEEEEVEEEEEGEGHGSDDQQGYEDDVNA